MRRVPDRWAATTRVQITQEEAERRIEAATMQALTAMGVDTGREGAGELLLGDADPDTAAFGDRFDFLDAALDDDDDSTHID